MSNNLNLVGLTVAPPETLPSASTSCAHLILLSLIDLISSPILVTILACVGDPGFIHLENARRAEPSLRAGLISLLTPPCATPLQTPECAKPSIRSPKTSSLPTRELKQPSSPFPKTASNHVSHRSNLAFLASRPAWKHPVNPASARGTTFGGTGSPGIHVAGARLQPSTSTMIGSERRKSGVTTNWMLYYPATKLSSLAGTPV